jgi:type I restriction enzyme S subunit
MKLPWPTKKLGEICEKIKKEKALVGTVPYIEIGNVDVNSKKVIFNEKGAVKGSIFAPENSILISRVRPTRGAVTFIDKKTAVSSAFTIIKPKPECNPKLLFYFLAWNRKFFDYLGERQKGTSYPSVREKDVLEFEISFPGNEEEQQKIVKILDTIQEAIDIQEKIIEKTKELKKSLMAELFKYGAPSFRKGRKLKKTEIGEIPEDWEVVRLREVCEVDWGNTSLTKAIYKKSGYPIFSATGQDGFADFYEQEGNAIILSAIGARAGKVFFASGKWTAIKNTIVIKVKKDNKADIRFIFYYVNNENYWKRSGSGQPFIALTTARNQILPFPPLPEQREIAEILQTIDQKIEIEKKKKELYEELFKTMLNKIMNQEIDVEKINLE